MGSTVTEESGPAPRRAWHHLPGNDVLEQLASSRDRGLSTKEVERRRRHWGPNTLPEPKRHPWWRIFVAQLKSPLIYLLFIAAGVAIALGERGDAAVILVVVLANAIIGAVQEGRAERSMLELRALSTAKVRVLRDGDEVMLAAKALVPGDIVLIAAGDAVAADARLLEVFGLQVAEASLTGESHPVEKAVEPVPERTSLGDRLSMIYAGTQATAGRARAVVVSTGLGTEVGTIAALTESAQEPKTPLERRIEQLGRYLAVGALAVVGVVFAVGKWRGVPTAEIFMVAVSQLVSVVPEGLPVAMTIALAVGTQRMAARRTIVRRLSAVEALGSTTVICTDKTGTLTRNEMTVAAISLHGGERLEVTGAGYVPEGKYLRAGREVPPAQVPGLLALLEAGALCNDAQLLAPKVHADAWRGLGDPTEVALVVAASKGGIDVEALRRQQPRRGELPFSAESKLMATVHGNRVLIKGAPEAVFALCAQPGPRAQVDVLAAQALRVLAIATLEGFEGNEVTVDALRGRVTLLGLVGQLDPPRDEAAAAVEECRVAGIRTMMVTGDHKVTALAVAKRLKIITADEIALDGGELDALSEAELAKLLPRLAVVSRAHPAQKLKIVTALQSLGDVVAMTGDGVNDAPALARADIGVAMGITGTEVAKEASKIVITDDNFATLVRAVEEGRVVYRNIKKAILHVLSTGAAELLTLLGAMVLGYPLPFAAVQILWNNVITEGSVTVNLVMDPKEGDEMRRPPIPRDEAILAGPMLRRGLLMSATIAASVLGYLAYRLGQGTPFAVAQTETFTLLVVCEWFNVLNCRSETKSALTLDLLKNRWLLGGLLLSNLLQVAVVFVPFLNQIFHTVPISPSSVILIGVVGSSVLWVEELRKWLARRALAAQR
jgi:Ca2+-transporting ATPase